ncbi:MAG: C4-dicarboxylate ABC transporter substrate-binding protein, partial [Actinobacteria bacterium RBG_13_35_12]
SNNVEGLIVTAMTSNASVENCNLIGRGQIETAFSQADVTYWAYTATGILKDTQPITSLRGIASLYPEVIHAIVTKASGIKTIEDLKGKRIGIGAPGSGAAAGATIILKAHGLTSDAVKVENIDYNEITQRMIDGQIDGGLICTGVGTASVIDVATKRDIVLVPISEEKIKELVAEYPYYSSTIIPAGAYKGVDEPVLSVATPALWICDAKLSPTVVYKMTKALWEQRAILEKVHSQGKNITLETALDGIGIPLHPGAELYYKEVGLIK